MTIEPGERLLRSLAGYHIHRILGTGGFGTVFAATREADRATVAIKTVRVTTSASRARLAVEVAALRAIGPPFVPEVYEHGSFDDGAPYFVCELIAIPSLENQLGKPMGQDEFFTIAGSILDAIEAVHAKGFIHRDLKPSNIFVSVAPRAAKLIDFGLAKPTTAVIESAADTKAGTVLGTPAYMAPEQCQGLIDLDCRADIYAVGVVLYEMWTGRTPFVGTGADVRVCHLSQRPPPPSRFVPACGAVDRVFMRCLAKAPKRRFQSIADLRRALTDALAKNRAGSTFVGAGAGRAKAGRGTRDTRMRNDRYEPGRSTDGADAMILAGLLFFEAIADTGTVMRIVEEFGGRLARVAGKQCVAVFGLDAGESPLDRALAGARAIIAQTIAVRVTLDRDRVRVYRRRDGSERILSASLHRRSNFAQAGAPHGVFLTPGCAHSLTEVKTRPVTGTDQLLYVLEPKSPPARAAAANRVIVGRERELGQLFESASRALDRRRPAIATVIGEIGCGKSLLGAALAVYLREQLPAAQVIEIHARESLGGDSNRTLRQLFGATLGLSNSVEPGRSPDWARAHITGRLGSELGQAVWPAVALIMGWIGSDAPEVRKLRAAPAALRAAAVAAAGRSLRRLAENRPLCCIVDDAHFADEATLDALEFATLAETALPIWVCVQARPSFADARPQWAGRAADRSTIKLVSLGDASAAELFRRLLRPAEEVPDPVIARMIEQTGGNPLFIHELARGVKRQGLIRRRKWGDTWYLASDELASLAELPLVEWLAERELSSLPAPLADHTRLVALVAPEFRHADIEGVLGQLEHDGLGDIFLLDAWVGNCRLCEKGILIEREKQRFCFRHPVIRQQVIRSTRAALRQQIHDAAYRYYSGAVELAEDKRLPLIAHHARESGRAGVAAAIYLELAEKNRDRHDYIEAELDYSWVLQLLTPGDRRARIRALSGRGLMRYRLSRFQDALDDIRAAQTIAEDIADRQAQAELFLDEATVLDWMCDFEAAQAQAEKARAVAPPQPSPLLAARQKLAFGRALLRLGDHDGAQRWLDRAAAEASRIGDRGYETLVIALMLQGFRLAAENHIDQAEALFDKAVALCRDRDDKLHLAAVLNNRLKLRIVKKDISGAVADGLSAQSIGREIGQIEIEYITSYKLAELYYYTGEFAAARPHIERAIAVEKTCSGRPFALLLGARISLVSDRIGEARTALAEIRAAQHRTRENNDRNARFAESEKIACDALEVAAARSPMSQWTELRRRAEASLRPVELAEFFEIAALTAERRGEIATAERLLDRALIALSGTSHLLEDRVRTRRDNLARGCNTASADGRNEPTRLEASEPEIKTKGDS
ncbi:MAG: protein kinase [Proteobacteria bacterium]|nr:protein kinase [Pseudomonadota bacterium]